MRTNSRAVSLLASLALSQVCGCFLLPVERVKLKALEIHAGYHGADIHSAEVGIGQFTYGSVNLGAGPCNSFYIPMTESYSLSARIQPGELRRGALEASVWRSGVIGVGLNATYYTDFSTGSFHLRPEFGVGDFPIGPVWIRGTVGWSIPITNTTFPGVNSLEIGVRVTLPLDTGKTKYRY